VVGKSRDLLGDAIDICADHCMSAPADLAPMLPDSEIIAVVFDKGMWSPRRQAIAELDADFHQRPRVVSVTCAKVSDVLPLQDADICATKNYWYGIEVLRNGVSAQPRAHMRHYLNHMVAQGFMIDRAKILEMLPDLQKKAEGAIEKELDTRVDAIAADRRKSTSEVTAIAA
jgi:hypothetical protein